MTTSTLHILFSSRAAGCLRRALRDAGREDHVACYFDNLALGPINPPDLQARQHWMEGELRCKESAWAPAEADAFWNASLAGDVRRIAWMSRMSSSEYCGFLDWLLRLGDLPCEVIDFTDLAVGSHRRALSPSMLSPRELAANSVWDLAKVVGADARAFSQPLAPAARRERATARGRRRRSSIRADHLL